MHRAAASRRVCRPGTRKPMPGLSPPWQCRKRDPRKPRAAQNEKAPSVVCSTKGRERQAACTNTPWPRERGEDGVPSCNRAERYKQERTPRAFAQGVHESSGDLLFRTRGPGTIGDLRLNFRVRDGNGCDPHSITAETNSVTWNLNSFAIARMPKPGGSGLPTRDS